jgi:hypothetical protein
MRRIWIFYLRHKNINEELTKLADFCERSRPDIAEWQLDGLFNFDEDSEFADSVKLVVAKLKGAESATFRHFFQLVGSYTDVFKSGSCQPAMDAIASHFVDDANNPKGVIDAREKDCLFLSLVKNIPVSCNCELQLGIANRLFSDFRRLNIDVEANVYKFLSEFLQWNLERAKENYQKESGNREEQMKG